MGIVLVGGGVRSGKSRFALDYAAERFERRAFIATAQAGDDEMAERIRRHQSARGPDWTTIEEPFDLAGALARNADMYDGLVVDCLTLWLSNVLLSPDHDAAKEIECLEQQLIEWSGLEGQGPKGKERGLILVTNEVGCGIVPDNALARRYRDLAGELNQSVARLSDEIYWMVFGTPLPVKQTEPQTPVRGKSAEPRVIAAGTPPTSSTQPT